MTAQTQGDVDAASPGEGRRIILDACALLNLYATRRIAEILRTLPRPCAVAAYVRDREALWVGRHRSGPAADYEAVDISPLVADGVLEVLTLDHDEELAHFVALAASVDDGEAVTGALAHARALVVATDDRAAIATFSRHEPPILTCSTAQVVKHWAECAAVDRATLRATLRDVRERACFAPGDRDPLHRWWHEVVTDGVDRFGRVANGDC